MATAQNTIVGRTWTLVMVMVVILATMTAAPALAAVSNVVYAPSGAVVGTSVPLSTRVATFDPATPLVAGDKIVLTFPSRTTLNMPTAITAFTVQQTGGGAVAPTAFAVDSADPPTLTLTIAPSSLSTGTDAGLGMVTVATSTLEGADEIIRHPTAVTTNASFTVETTDSTDVTKDGPTTVNNVEFVHDVVADLVLVAEPSNSTGGVPLSTQPVFQAQDRHANLVTTDPDAETVESVSVALTSPGDATLAGSTSVAVDWSTGRARFTDLSVDLAGSYSLTATQSGMADVVVLTPRAFTITTGDADADDSTVSAAPTSLVADGAASTEIAVTLRDAGGNPVEGAAVGLSGTGSSTISEASGPSDASGVVTFTATSATAETVTYTATVGRTIVMETVDVTFTAPQPAPAPQPTTSVSRNAAPGETTSTDVEGDGATASDPVEAGVTLPPGGSGGLVTVDTATATDDAASGYGFLGVQVDITAPVQTAEEPLELVFQVDASVLPEGSSAGNLEVFRNGVRVGSCLGATVADPDPCVSARADEAGDAELVVLTSKASRWTFAVATSACPDRSVPTSGFGDLEGNRHAANIGCMAWWGVVNSRTDTTYAPGPGVRRDQAASFLARALEAAGVELPAHPADRFVDDETSVDELAINQLAELGVLDGTSVDRFSPSAVVTRGQMASLLVEAYELASGTTLPAGADAFSDDDGTTHEAAIDAAAAAGFAKGRYGSTFAPGGPVQRDHVASFLARVLDRLVGEGVASIPSA